MSPPVSSTRSPAPPQTRPTSPRWRRYCTARRKRSLPMPATPGRPSAPNTPGARCRGTSPIKRGIIKALPKTLRDLAEPEERALAQLRAWVEHPFHIVKNLFRHKKLRYRGLAKNTMQLYTLFALANLAIVKKTLLAPAQA